MIGRVGRCVHRWVAEPELIADAVVNGPGEVDEDAAVVFEQNSRDFGPTGSQRATTKPRRLPCTKRSAGLRRVEIRHQ
jgi:hypothetical protein